MAARLCVGFFMWQHHTGGTCHTSMAPAVPPNRSLPMPACLNTRNLRCSNRCISQLQKLFSNCKGFELCAVHLPTHPACSSAHQALSVTVPPGPPVSPSLPVPACTGFRCLNGLAFSPHPDTVQQLQGVWAVCSQGYNATPSPLNLTCLP